MVSRLRRHLRYLLAWVLIRPRRWAFHRMMWHDRPLGFRRRWDGRLLLPNCGWWLLHLTLWRFFRWLYWDGWRPLCRWGERQRLTYPWYAQVVHRVGATTAGHALSGSGECYHCAHPDGCAVELSDDETGRTFELEGQGVYPSQDGTDYRFWGTTICPRCGYRARYEDGSL